MSPHFHNLQRNKQWAAAAELGQGGATTTTALEICSAGGMMCALKGTAEEGAPRDQKEAGFAGPYGVWAALPGRAWSRDGDQAHGHSSSAPRVCWSLSSGKQSGLL